MPVAPIHGGVDRTGYSALSSGHVATMIATSHLNIKNRPHA